MKRRKLDVESSKDQDRNTKLRERFRNDLLNHLNINTIIRFYNALNKSHVRCFEYKRTQYDIKKDKRLNVACCLKFSGDENYLDKTLYVTRGENILEYFNKKRVIPKSDPNNLNYKKVVVGFLNNRKNYSFIKKMHEIYWMIYNEYKLPLSINGQRGLAEWCYHALFNIVPDTAKREKESMIVNSDKVYEEEINHLKLCGVLIPSEIVALIFSYFEFNSELMFKVGLINWNFYTLCLANWKDIRVTPGNVYKFPITVLNYVKDVTLHFVPFTKLRANHINHLLTNLKRVSRLKINNTDKGFIKKKKGQFSNCTSLILDYYKGITEEQLTFVYEKFPFLEKLCISNYKINPIPKEYDFLKRINMLFLANESDDIKSQPEIDLPNVYSKLENLKDLAMDFSLNLSHKSRLKLAKLENLKKVLFSVNGVNPRSFEKIPKKLSGFFEKRKNKLEDITIIYKTPKTMEHYQKSYIDASTRQYLDKKGFGDVNLIIKHKSF